MLPIALDWIDSAKVSILIVGGIVASSLSSALAALVGAPRVFQAVCEDPLFPPLKPFAHVPREQYAYTGYSDTSLAANVNPQYSGTESWVSLFSVFFPASTGIMAGANISGDLKDAQKAISSIEEIGDISVLVGPVSYTHLTLPTTPYV